MLIIIIDRGLFEHERTTIKDDNYDYSKFLSFVHCQQSSLTCAYGLRMYTGIHSQ